MIIVSSNIWNVHFFKEVSDILIYCIISDEITIHFFKVAYFNMLSYKLLLLIIVVFVKISLCKISVCKKLSFTS